MTVRQDNRLLDAPMVPVGCRQCGARVQVRKSSWQQTSIQWDTEAMDTCLERRAGPDGGRFTACEALRETIARAALNGHVPVPDDHYGPVATVPEAP
ncbi:ferredoxin [Microtetraspora malaysiensis]|uniref:Ferredoxin n=1 Tax=Microtetraspora malaysiensis TaxID=161358 RepID=A0ABW6T0M7_9ACTN